MEIEVVSAKNSKVFGKCHVPATISIGDLPAQIHKQLKSTPAPNRQSLRLDPRGKALKDSDTLQSLNLRNGVRIYVKDLGPQIAWTTVFLSEYAGPLLVYLLFYARPSIIYGADADKPISLTAHIAAACYTVHYVKRLLETIFVHRFSHATMPIRNLFKNCSYYWGFTAYVSYHVNHPLFTSPCQVQVLVGLAAFALCEIGNFSIHIALRNLRPPGTKVRKIPMPDSNPFTQLFNLVSCPNYTYEIGAWVSFSIMTNCLAAVLFAIAGGYQMMVWALGKHRNYKKEFTQYPKSRKAIFPFIL
ncbi:very-long-chain enoyl-CoA reductase-like [Teleopsis dalmanni]|uniref:very-long-chain enoyl-CoA reductase-like n=1 Tax=Teleopsis dalmanni TaxID=139649 RepID=UPI0018CCD039|nr:very-long-chain enoyl-CoA reductase-like [Teleopsis dalmanni]XP_037939468.1 very-long-chain enoyl-CoA reductase-like [Teleopsis dalmanni]XP_037939473.1 very-long-chain enoyl-CoA reductase-like [Teleopsis dalmanni]